MTPGDLITLLVIAGGVWLLVQFTGLKIWHAVLVLAAGFYLALSPSARTCTSSCPGSRDCSATRP
jgi:hypothetical protein